MTYPVFPSMPGQAIGIRRKPLWRTGVQSAISGKETRIAYMSYPLYQWTLDMNVLRSSGGLAELAQMIGFVNSLQGMASPFLFTDTEDNTVTAQGFGTGDGSTKNFQLVRAYGGYVEPVQQPNVISQITVAGTPTSAYTMGSNGVVQFTTAPASGAALAWSGTFYFLCRMLQDDPEFLQELSYLWSTKSLQFQSIKL